MTTAQPINHSSNHSGKTPSIKIAIIGAGIAGLTIAKRLQTAMDNSTIGKMEITMFEKARGVSGRTSTRRAEPFHFDHGAPFFTIKSERFQSFIQPMLAENIVTDWQANVVEMTGTTITESHQWQENTHFIAQPKMNEMAKFLAKGLNVKLGTRVGKIEKVENNQWLLTSDTGAKVGRDINETPTLGERGDLGVFDWVICTAPAEQSAKLVPTDLPFYPRIANSQTEGCYTLMLGFATPQNFGLEVEPNRQLDVALIKDSDLSCIVVNSQKPHRPKHFAVTVLSSNQWAQQHIDDDQAWIQAHLLATASKTLRHDLSNASHIALHRWRYANTSLELEQHNQGKTPFLLDTPAQFAVAGDWLIVIT